MRWTRTALLMMLAASVLPAQGAVRGVVFDSLLTHGPLAGAHVVAQGHAASATTDRRGRYTLRGLPAGRHRVTFFHPALDSLEISIPTREVEVGTRGSVALALAVPSRRAVALRFCEEDPAPQTAIVFGVVRAAEDGLPLEGAVARVTWFEASIASGRVRESARAAESRTGADGRYVLCGVPSDIAVSMQVVRDGQASGLLHLALDGAELARRDVAVSLGDTAARVVHREMEDDTTRLVHPRGSASLRLLVRDDRGRAVRGATVGVRGTSVFAVTDDSGRVLLAGAPAGSQTIVARAIGKAPALRVLALAPGATTEAEFALPPLATTLPRVAVIGRRPDFTVSQWELRRKAGFGHFFEEAEMQRLRNGTSFWARIPGVTLYYGSSTEFDPMPLMLAPVPPDRCFPNVWVDGARQSYVGGWELRMLMLGAKRSEIYTRALNVPAQFATPGSGCGAIIIWTN